MQNTLRVLVLGTCLSFLSAGAFANDLGGRDVLWLSGEQPSSGELLLCVHVTNDEELLALDIPLRFGKAGDPITLVRVDFGQRVAAWDFKHAQIDNDEKTVILGLIASLTGEWENSKLSASAEGESPIATLVFKTAGDFAPSVEPFYTEYPGHALTFIYNRVENGKPYVEEFAPAFTSQVSYKQVSRPLQYALSENYPNPFNPATSFTLTVPLAVDYAVRIFNVTGQLVRTINGHVEAGVHEITWDGKNNQGVSVASGVYFWNMRAGDLDESRRMVFMK